MDKCDLCGSFNVTSKDDFQTLCHPCHLREQIKENNFFIDIIEEFERNFKNEINAK